MDDEAGLFLAAAVIEQGVRDWRAARKSQLIDENGKLNLEKLKRFKTKNLPGVFEGLAEVESLRSFFHGGGIDIWIAFSGLRINPDLIVNGLEKSIKNKRQVLHWHKHDRPRGKESFNESV